MLQNDVIWMNRAKYLPAEAKLPFEVHAVPPSVVQLQYVNQALEEIMRQKESTGTAHAAQIYWPPCRCMVLPQ